MADMVAKGRAKSSGVHGEGHGNAKLSEEDVAAIRERYATGCVTQKQLGREYNVNQSTISSVVNHHLWARA
jgi:hypothetical protein